MSTNNNHNKSSDTASAPLTAVNHHHTTPSHQTEQEATKMTCDVLCSLGKSGTPPPSAAAPILPPPPSTLSSGGPPPHAAPGPLPPVPVASSFPSSLSAAAAAVDSVNYSSCGATTSAGSQQAKRRSSSGSTNSKSCPKQHQLPMFLSKTYHMIDRCDPEIATWSETGDNFVVKNVEKFATNVLPLYFKHSNFASFARQLNFYGFRKLRSDPILTSDVDPRTAAYVRFYHDKFQKDKPEMLHLIKRATKASDQQSKDDLDCLKQEIAKLQQANVNMKQDFDKRMNELAYECNRRVAALNADYDKLFALVQSFISNSAAAAVNHGAAAAGYAALQQQAVAAVPQPAPPHHDVTAAAVAALRDLPTRTHMPDLLHSLGHAAFRAAPPAAAPHAPPPVPTHTQPAAPAAATAPTQQQQPTTAARGNENVVKGSTTSNSSTTAGVKRPADE